MSENIPESVPTSRDPRSKRPLKRRALSPASRQASEVEALFTNPDRDIAIPDTMALSKKSGLPAPPEIVANVQGSSAGAGSGEFHVYKASRRREYERLKTMDEENAQEEANCEFEKRKEENKWKDLSKTEKNRKKREKQRQRKEGKGTKTQDGDDIRTEISTKGDIVANGHKREKSKSQKTNNGGTATDSILSITEDDGGGVIIHDDS